jgi:ribosome-associated protein
LSLELARLAACAATNKTLEETTILEVSGLVSITEYFVITAGRNERQVHAILDEIGATLRAAGEGPPRHVEGQHDGRWVLVDYGSFVVHIFEAESREFYGLERLWSDAPRIAFDLADISARS